MSQQPWSLVTKPSIQYIGTLKNLLQKYYCSAPIWSVFSGLWSGNGPYLHKKTGFDKKSGRINAENWSFSSGIQRRRFFLKLKTSRIVKEV